MTPDVRSCPNSELKFLCVDGRIAMVFGNVRIEGWLIVSYSLALLKYKLKKNTGIIGCLKVWVYCIANGSRLSRLPNTYTEEVPLWADTRFWQSDRLVVRPKATWRARYPISVRTTALSLNICTPSTFVRDKLLVNSSEIIRSQKESNNKNIIKLSNKTVWKKEKYGSINN